MFAAPERGGVTIVRHVPVNKLCAAFRW